MVAAIQTAQKRQLNTRRRSSVACQLEAALRGKDVGQKETVQLIVKVDRQRIVRDERTRIARELHDTFLQTLLGAGIQLGVAVERLPSDSPIKRQLDRILQLMNQGIEEGRNTIQGLRSSESHGVDLVRAFSELQQEIDVQSEVDFRVTVIGRKQALRSRIANEVYRIGREALVNALRHSGAKRIELELQYAETGLWMRVRDDGCGIDPRVLHAGREGHWGLTGMRERATRIAASLNISSSAADGTQVQLFVPGALAVQPNKPAMAGQIGDTPYESDSISGLR